MDKTFKSEEINDAYENQNCKGKCILEMEKRLDSKAISEFLTVIRDFHNDDQTLANLKNTLYTLHKETAEILNKKTKEILTVIDNLFLHRRQQQTSFYRLCHKLVRKELPDGPAIPDESKCICFSEKNLKKYNVDPAADPNIQLVTNFNDVKNYMKCLTGTLQCTKCLEFGIMKKSYINNEFHCVCSAPSPDTQLKVHESMLDIYESQEQMMIADSWYLTHLKRDAEYYQNRCRNSLQPSDESVDSFEIISHTCVNSINSDYNKNESETKVNEEEKMKIPQHKICSVIQKLAAANMSDIESYDDEEEEDYESEDDKRERYLRNLESYVSGFDKISKAKMSSACMTDDCKKTSTAEQQTDDENLGKLNNSLKFSNQPLLNKLTPAEIIKQSFTPFLNKSYSPFNSNTCNVPVNAKTTFNPSVMLNTQTKDVSFRPLDKNLVIVKSELVVNKNQLDPCNALKAAFSKYSSKETSKWLSK